MIKKRCRCCQLNKLFKEFYYHKTHKDGLRSECKECTIKKVKRYSLKHKKQISKTKKIYRQRHLKKIIKQMRNYYLAHKQERKEYLKKNKKRIEKVYKKWYIKNKSKKAKYQVKRRKNNINARISHCLRQRIYKTLISNIKSNSTVKLLGCSIEFLKKYLESKFTEGMNWDNYGTGWNGKGMKEWHIDHIIPCCQFILSKPSEQRKCFYYTNLQPLWAKENRQKCRKLS